MGLGQTMLTTMFLVLLTLAVISGNRLMIDRETSFYEQEAYKQSGILANELLQEIVRKKFDSKVTGIHDTDKVGYMDSTLFDAPGSLGPPASGSSYVNPGGAPDTYPYKSIDNNASHFDDVDDYKGYIRSANAGNLTGFILTVDVYYVKKSGSTYVKATSYQRYTKQVIINVVNSKYLKNTLVYSTIVSY